MVDFASQVKIPDYSSVLSNVQGLASLQGNILQQRALEQQIKANESASQAMKAATDPTTGKLDQAKFATLMSQGAGAYNLPTYLKNATDLENAQLETQNKRIEQTQKQLGFWGSQLGGLMTKGNKVSGGDVIQSLANGIQLGMVTPEQAREYAKQIPSDPSQIQDWVKTHWVSLQSAKDQMAALMPQTQIVNTGGQTQILNIDPLTGKPKIAGALQNTLTAGELAQEIPGVTPEGVPFTQTRAQRLGMSSNAPIQGQQGYTGRFPGTQQVVTPQFASGLPPGAVQTGLSPAEQARQVTGASAQSDQAAKAAQRLSDEVANIPMQLNLLNSATDALSNIKNTGPGTDWRNSFASALQSTPYLGQALNAMGVVDPHEVASYDEFKKIMTNYASSISGSVGSGTDARLNAAITGNANPAISKLANEDILVKTKAGLQMRQALNDAFQNSGNPPDKFNRFQAQWNKTVSPDAFAFVNMNAAQQKSFIDRLNKSGGLKKFKSDLTNLVNSGLIQMPGGQ